MNRKTLLNAINAANVEIPAGRNTVADLRRIFAENRRAIEELLGVNGENADDEENLDDQNDDVADEHPNENIEEHQREPLIPLPQQPLQNEIQNPEPPQQIQVNANDEELDRELNRLRRQHEILRLRQEIARMEQGDVIVNVNVRTQGSANTTTSVPTNVRKIHFHDIEHAIVKFSGEDRTYSVDDFFRHLEQIFRQVNADDLLKFLALRNSLTGAARLLLTRGALTYEDMKTALIKEFG